VRACTVGSCLGLIVWEGMLLGSVLVGDERKPVASRQTPAASIKQGACSSRRCVSACGLVLRRKAQVDWNAVQHMSSECVSVAQAAMHSSLDIKWGMSR
jgi:hypothetical protein